MNLLNAKVVISTSVISFILGVITMIISMNGCHKPASGWQPTTILQNQNEVIKKYYNRHIAVLKNKNIALQNKIDSLNRKLEQSKRKTSTRQQRIEQLVEPKGFLAKDLLRKSKTIDKLARTINCDSLAIEVSEYIVENQQKDSIYEQKIIVQDSVITFKDSIITLQNNFISGQQEIIAVSLITQDKMAKENEQLRKKIKRRKFSSKLAVTIAAIASTLTTLLITSN